MLTTNDRVIKLWKMKEKHERSFSKCQVEGNQIIFPKAQTLSSALEGHERSQYKNCHHFNINSLSSSPDGEAFISADDLCVNLWNLEN